MAHMGDRIRAEREALGLSILQLATVAGISKQAMSKIELGITLDPSVNTIEPILRRLNLTLGWTLHGRLPKYASQAVGLDFKKITQAQTFLAQYLQLYNSPKELLHNPELLQFSYEAVDEEEREHGSVDVVDFMRRLRQKVETAAGKQDGTQRREDERTAQEDGRSGATRARKAKAPAG